MPKPQTKQSGLFVVPAAREPPVPNTSIEVSKSELGPGMVLTYLFSVEVEIFVGDFRIDDFVNCYKSSEFISTNWSLDPLMSYKSILMPTPNLISDISKNHTRRWCTMVLCGNCAKAAAHCARKRSA